MTTTEAPPEESTAAPPETHAEILRRLWSGSTDLLGEVPVLTGPYQVCRPLTKDEYNTLGRSICEHGVLQAIKKDEDGNTIDGHYREHIAAELGIEPPIEWRGPTPVNTILQAGMLQGFTGHTSRCCRCPRQA